VRLRPGSLTLWAAWLAWLGWLGGIFFLSSQGSLGAALRGGDLLRDLLAKLAHVVEYGVLALLTAHLLRQYGVERRKRLMWAILFAALYGAGDEWHQSFVPGREPRVTDVLIDAAGAAAGLWLAAWAGRLKVSRLKVGRLKEDEWQQSSGLKTWKCGKGRGNSPT
jgi:VanZ family protein